MFSTSKVHIETQSTKKMVPGGVLGRSDYEDRTLTSGMCVFIKGLEGTAFPLPERLSSWRCRLEIKNSTL